MSLPIAPTPTLTGKDAEKFMAMVEKGLKNPVGPVPTPKIDDAIRRIKLLAEVQANERISHN